MITHMNLKTMNPLHSSNGPQEANEASTVGLPWLSTVGIYFWKADGGA